MGCWHILRSSVSAKSIQPGASSLGNGAIYRKRHFKELNLLNHSLGSQYLCIVVFKVTDIFRLSLIPRLAAKVFL